MGIIATESYVPPVANEEQGQPPKGDENLGQKMVKGGAWLFGLKICVRGVTFLSTLILARLLAPSDFGILGICLLAITLLETLSQTGFESALIQKKGDVGEYLDSAWIIAVIRGIVLGLILFLSAPFVAGFFDSPKSGDVLRVLALSPVLAGLANIGMVLFNKELDFKKIFIYEISYNIVYALVATTLAFVLRNVWALVYGTLAARFTTFVVSYVIHPYRPKLNLELKKAKELFDFGKWMLGTQVIVYFTNQGDKMFLGKLLGATSLGFYSVAYRISHMAFTEITLVLFRVMFPAYSKLQDNTEKLKDIYLKMLQVLGFFTIPFSGMIFVLAPEFTSIVLGEKWLPIIPLLRILSISGLFISVGATAGPLLQGVGRPEIVTKILALRLIITALLIYPLTKSWGMMGTAMTVLLSLMVVEPIEIYMAAKLSGNGIKVICKNLFIPFANTALILIFVLYFKEFFVNHYGIPGLIFLGFISGLSYLLLTYSSDKLVSYPALTLMGKAFLKGIYGTGK